MQVKLYNENVIPFNILLSPILTLFLKNVLLSESMLAYYDSSFITLVALLYEHKWVPFNANF